MADRMGAVLDRLAPPVRAEVLRGRSPSAEAMDAWSKERKANGAPR